MTHLAPDTPSRPPARRALKRALNETLVEVARLQGQGSRAAALNPMRQFTRNLYPIQDQSRATPLLLNDVEQASSHPWSTRSGTALAAPSFPSNNRGWIHPSIHEHRAQGVFLCGLRRLTHLDVEGVILKHRLGLEGRVNGFARSSSVPLGRICFRNDLMVPSERIV